jgi:hypothetical protein
LHRIQTIEDDNKENIIDQNINEFDEKYNDVEVEAYSGYPISACTATNYGIMILSNV